MSSYINRLMARFGYVPASALDALEKPGIIPSKIWVENTQAVVSLDLIQRLNIAAGTVPATGAGASGLPS